MKCKLEKTIRGDKGMVIFSKIGMVIAYMADKILGIILWSIFNYCLLHPNTCFPKGLEDYCRRDTREWKLRLIFFW